MPQSVDRALDLLDAVAGADGPVPAKALARQLGCGLSTAYELLGTLTARGHLARTTAGYTLGHRVPALHQAFRRQLRTNPDDGQVHGLLLRARRSAGADTYFSTYRDGDIAVLAAATSALPGDPKDTGGTPVTGGFTLGRDTDGHATAHGKVLLAALDRAARQRYLTATGMRPITPRTITSPERPGGIRRFDPGTSALVPLPMGKPQTSGRALRPPLRILRAGTQTLCHPFVGTPQIFGTATPGRSSRP